MTDYEALLAASRRKLCQIRDRRKAMQDLSHDDFYYHVSKILRARFSLRVSPGWIRSQCLGDTDPSFLRFGALLNFLDEYDEDGVRVEGDVEEGSLEDRSSETVAPSFSEDVPDLDSPTPYLDALKREHSAGKGYKVDLKKPNPLMLAQAAAAKRRQTGG